jgi:hypothetical protein
VTYVATVADCVFLNNPDPDLCESVTGSGLMSVDKVNAGIADAATSETAAFLRFEPDGATAGKSVTSVRLQLTVGPDTNSAPSNMSGAVWTVASFTRPDLFNAAPAKSGAAIGTDQGAITASATVTWTLPNSLVKANTPVFLGVFTQSSNGADYVNLKGASKPSLLVDYQ